MNSKKRNKELDSNVLERALESVRERNSYILMADNAVETKAGVVAGFSILIVVQILLRFEYLFSIPALLFLISFGYSLSIFFSKKYKHVVSFSKNKGYLGKEYKEFLLQLISDYENYYDYNKDIQGNKTGNFKTSLYFFIAGTVAFLLILITKLI